MLWEGVTEAFFREGGQERNFWERDVVTLKTEGRVEINRRVEGNKAISWPLKKLGVIGGAKALEPFWVFLALEPFEALKGLSEVLIPFTFLQIPFCYAGSGLKQQQEVGKPVRRLA